MATALLESKISETFHYDHLVSQIVSIRTEIDRYEKILDERCQTEKKIPEELQSRSFVFVDPYGNRIVNQQMDHLLISKVMKKYKNDYIPKYLHSSIQIGTMEETRFSPITKYQLQLTVDQFPDGYEFVALAQVVVWIQIHSNSPFFKNEISVRLVETMKNIERQIKEGRSNPMNIVMKLWIKSHEQTPNDNDWKNSKILNSDETILSSQLYKEDHSLLIKPAQQDVSLSIRKWNFVLTIIELTARRSYLTVVPSMLVKDVKILVEKQSGIPIDQQRLIYSSKQLEDQRTLSDYNIIDDSIIHLVLRLRGGMFHFTSNRQDFDSLPFHCKETIGKILQFQTKHSASNTKHVSLAQLQKLIFQWKQLLFKLATDSRDIRISPELVPLEKIISLSEQQDDTSDSDSDDSMDQ